MKKAEFVKMIEEKIEEINKITLKSVKNEEN